MNLSIRMLSLALATTATLAGCATTSGSTAGAPPYSSSTATCYDCGTVTRIEQTSGGSSVPNATGAVVGGLVGAAVGHEVANDSSKGKQNTATVAGAVAGALAGNAIQNHAQAQGAYNVYVRMNDGRSTVVTQGDLGGIREGSYVRVTNGRAQLM